MKKKGMLKIDFFNNTYYRGFRPLFHDILVDKL